MNQVVREPVGASFIKTPFRKDANQSSQTSVQDLRTVSKKKRFKHTNLRYFVFLSSTLFVVNRVAICQKIYRLLTSALAICLVPRRFKKVVVERGQQERGFPCVARSKLTRRLATRD